MTVRSGALPVYQQIVLDLLVPPLGAFVWWFMARGWAATVQGGEITERTKQRQKKEFWVILIAAYLIMFGITIYAALT